MIKLLIVLSAVFMVNGCIKDNPKPPKDDVPGVNIPDKVKVIQPIDKDKLRPPGYDKIKNMPKLGV